jgi:hypothetical protein
MKIYGISVDDTSIEPFRNKYRKIQQSILAGEFPSSSTVLVTIRKQIENKIDQVDWVLSIFADTMRLVRGVTACQFCHFIHETRFFFFFNSKIIELEFFPDENCHTSDGKL